MATNLVNQHGGAMFERKARVSFRVAEGLRGRGVSVVFGVVGHANYRLVTDFVQLGGRYIAMRHETGAVAAADSYARLTGTVGVATVTQGPGLTNAATSLVEARKSRTPILLIAGDTIDGSEDNQDLDQDAFAESLGVVPIWPTSAETAASETIAGFDLALETCQAVLVSLPQDVQSTTVDASRISPLTTVAPLQPEQIQIDAAVQQLIHARRPIVLAGRGSLISGAGPALAKLAECLGAPLTTTAQAHGLFSGNPSSLGICGGYAKAGAWETLRQADLIIAVGASLSKWTTRSGELLADADIVHVDVEPRGDHIVCGDARLAAEGMLDALRQCKHQAAPWAHTVRELDPLNAGDEAGMDPATATITLNNVLPRDRIIVLDSGHHIGWPVRYLEVPNERSWVFAQGFQSVGLGLAGAIGAGQAFPERLVVAPIGDGGLAMTLGELDSAVRSRSHILVVVYDDRAYGAELHRFEAANVPVELSLFDRIDFAAIAQAVGAQAATVERSEEIPRALKDWLLNPTGVFLLHMLVSPNLPGPWAKKSTKYHKLQEAWRATSSADRSVKQQRLRVTLSELGSPSS